ISYSKDIIGVGLIASAGWFAAGSIRFRNQKTAEKEKGPTRVGPVTDQLFYGRPGPDDPGGLGAEESGIERTGPTQVFLSQFSRAVGGRKWGGIMIPLTIL